jgi:hypothetical protein
VVGHTVVAMSAVALRLVRWSTSLALAAALLAGCLGGGPESPAPGSDTSPSAGAPSAPASAADARQRALAETDLLLEARARAVRDRDRSAFLATSDLSRDRFVRKQRTLFANLKALPIASFDYRTAETEARADEGSGADGEPPDSETVTISREVIEAVELRRTDRLPVVNSLQVTFTRTGTGADGTWLVSNERPARGTAVFGGVQSRPWGGSAIHAVRRDALLVVIDDSLRDRADDLADLVANEVGATAELLGVRSRSRLLVDATSSGVSTRIGSKRTAALAVYFDVFGLAEGDAEPRLAGHRIKFHPRRVAELIADRVLVRHELTHYLTDAADAPVPKWASEGLANYVSYFPLRPSGLVLPAETYDRAQARSPALPSSDSFGGVVDYVVAQAAVTYLIDEFGMSRFGRFLADFESSAGPADDQVRRVLRRRYGISRTDLVRETWVEIDKFNRG